MPGSHGRVHAGRSESSARVLLAGRFAQPGCLDRSFIEALIGDEHDVLPEPAALRPADRGRLPTNAADLVVVDLSGTVSAVLELIAHLRLAVDNPGVPLLGVMPDDIDPRHELYLAAVVDETVAHEHMAERLPCLVRSARQDPVGDASGGSGEPGRETSAWSWADACRCPPTRH